MTPTLRKLSLLVLTLVAATSVAAPGALAYKTDATTPLPSITIATPLLRLEDDGSMKSTRVEFNAPGLEADDYGATGFGVKWKVSGAIDNGTGGETPIDPCADGGVLTIAKDDTQLTGCTVTLDDLGIRNGTVSTIYVGAKKRMRISVSADLVVAPGATKPPRVINFSSQITVSDKTGPTLPSIEGMSPDPLVTTLGHVTIRARDLLGYALRMHQDLTKNDSTNPIYVMYAKSRQVANVLFIIALVLIAFFYNFAILISRDRLRRLLILFTIAIIGVNFSYTLTTLAVQGSEKLFNILLVRDDQGTQVEGGDVSGSAHVAVAGEQITEEDLLTAKNFTYSGFVGASKTDPVDTTRTAPDAKEDLQNNRFRENIYFNLALMVAGALAQFAIVLVLLARIMILWALIIVAPFFFLLAIFKFSQEIFKYWGWFFTRWILIGPLLALFLSVCVRIWTSAAGIPITSEYERANLNTFFPNIINIWVGAPGVRDLQGINLETPDQVMKYLMGLMMLWMAVLLPFWLTRRISIFSPQGEPTLLSKLLGSGKTKVKVEPKLPKDPEGPKVPPTLKGGFTFKDAVRTTAAVSAVTKTSVPTTATATASASATAASKSQAGATTSQLERDRERERAVASAVSRASLGASRSSGVTTGTTTTLSTAAEAVVRGAARRLDGSSIDVTALATQAKPKAVPRSMDAQVQTVARAATKSEVSAAQLKSLTQSELSDLRTNLSSLASSNVLGQNSVVSRNLRAIDEETRNRSRTVSEQRELRVKVQATADQAQTTRLQASDLRTLKLAELQSLRSEIEARVAADASLKRNDTLRANYQLLTTQIASQSVGSIASINTAITAQTHALVQAISNASVIERATFKSLSVPELKEASLSLHRMERALHSSAGHQVLRDNLALLQQARRTATTGALDPTRVAAAVSRAATQRLGAHELEALSGMDMDAVSRQLEALSAGASQQVIHDNLATVNEGRAARSEGEMHSAQVDAVLAKATSERLSAADLATLSGRDIDAISAELSAIEALGSKLQTSVTVDASSPEYKESVVVVRSEVKAREQAAGGASTDGGASHPALVAQLMEKLVQGGVLGAAELASLSLTDLRSLNRQASAVGVDGPDQPLGPDGDALERTLAAINHEQEQRRTRGVSVPDASPTPLATALGKVRSNAVLQATDLAVLGDMDLEWLRGKVSDMLAAARGEAALADAVDGIQQELRARRLDELKQRAAAQSPKVAELFTALVGGARLKTAVLSSLTLDDQRLLAELGERAASLIDHATATSPDFTASLRDVERAFQKSSLELLVRRVLESSAPAQAVLAKVKAADAVSAGELEALSLPELEAVQAESYRLNLIAPAQVKAQPTYQDNLGIVTQVYEARVIEGRQTADGSDGSSRFIAQLQAQVGSQLQQKIAELKSANKDDLAAELTAQQDDLGQLVDRASELASQRAEWIEYFRATPVPKVEGITSRRAWVEAERKLTRAIAQEIASQDWVLQAKGIADAASNLLMGDTTGMSPVQVLTALALKEAAAGEALKLQPADDDELVLVPVAKEAAAAAAKLRTFDEDDQEASRGSPAEPPLRIERP